MRNYIAFTKKELLESTRTYKLLIMLIAFFVFGIMSPLAAKLMPDIIGAAMPEGMTVSLGEPSAIDAWSQFFKNISQICLIITMIIFSGTLSAELSKGTLVNLLTKGLPRGTVILSKFTGMFIVWTLSYALSFIMAWVYTMYLFPGDQQSNLLFSVFCQWLYVIFLLSVLLFAATLMKSSYGCLLATVSATGALGLLYYSTELRKYTPTFLAVNNLTLLEGTVEASTLSYAVAASVICTVIMIIASVLVFRKRQL